MGWLTNGYIRFAVYEKETDLFFSIRGHGRCNLCELEILDTYESEKAALQAIETQVHPDWLKERLLVTKVVYEFHKHNEDTEYDTTIDETVYTEKKDILPCSFTYDFDAAMQFKREMEKEIPGIFDKLSVVEMDKLIDFVHDKTMVDEREAS